MAIAMKGLRLKPTYEDLISVAASDGLEQINFPNRDASFLKICFILSQLDGEGMRAMEEQQQRHMNEVYMESALKPLASNLDNESVSNLSFNSAYTQDTQTQRAKEMLARANGLRKANAKNGNTEYYDLEMEPQLALESVPSSSPGHGQVDLSDYIHVEDPFGSIRNIENDYVRYRLKEM